MRRLGRIFGRIEGAEIAEAALVLPLVFMFLLGIVWFGRAFNIYSTITQAAQQGAVTAARATCATCPSGNTFPSDTTIRDSVYSVMNASSLDPAQIIAPVAPAVQDCPAPIPAHTCAAPDNIMICQRVVLNPSGSPPLQCGTTVTLQYPFKFVLPFSSLSMQQYILTAQAQTRMEN